MTARRSPADDAHLVEKNDRHLLARAGMVRLLGAMLMIGSSIAAHLIVGSQPAASSGGHMTTAAWVGIVAGVVAVLGTIVALVRTLVRAPLAAENESLARTLEREQERFADVDARLHTLQRDFANLKLEKTDLLLKTDIDAGLRHIMDLLDVSESSILVPGPLQGSSTFVFLSIYGPAAAKLRMAKLPIDKGIVGRVFETGTLHNTAKASDDPSFFKGIDKRGGHETRALLTLPLVHKSRVIGVMQFLNKPGGFSGEDESKALALSHSLATQVHAFVRDPENFELLGLAWRDQDREATIAFCDLTASSSLLDHMNAPSAVDCINEYFEQQCEIAMGLGATVDNYIGDAVMLSFNVPRPISDGDHVIRAVEASLLMREAFDRLKENWVSSDLPVGPVFGRIGLSCGSVYEAKVGHSQLQRLTLIGQAVNEAANLCERAARDRSIIVIDERIRGKLGSRFIVEASTPLAGRQTFEVKGLR